MKKKKLPAGEVKEGALSVKPVKKKAAAAEGDDVGDDAEKKKKKSER